MSPLVVPITREALLERRAAILEGLSLPVEDLRRLADRGGLSSDDTDALDALDEIAFLLDDPVE